MPAFARELPQTARRVQFDWQMFGELDEVGVRAEEAGPDACIHDDGHRLPRIFL
jgi:hypothetical protein